MAASDSTPLPIKGCIFRCYPDLWLTTGLPNTGAADIDSEVMLDGGSFADAASDWTEIATGSGYQDLTGAEMDTSATKLQIKSSTTNAITYKLTINPVVLASISTGTLSAGSAGGGTLGTILPYDLTGCYIKTTGGTGGGGTGGANNQARKIVTYNASTGAFTVEPNWGTTPSTDTTYSVLLPPGVTLGMLKTLNPATAGRTLVVDSAGLADANVVKNAGTAITSASGIQEVKVASLASAAIQSIWDALTSALTTSGSIGKWILDKLDAVVSTRLASSSYTAPPSAATNASAVRTELTTELGRIDAAVSSRLASGSYTAPDNAGIAAIQAVTDALPDAGALTSLATQASVDAVPTADENALAAKLYDWETISDPVPDYCDLQALRASRNKVDVSDGANVKVYEEDGTTLAWSQTIHTNAAAIPIDKIG